MSFWKRLFGRSDEKSQAPAPPQPPQQPDDPLQSSPPSPAGSPSSHAAGSPSGKERVIRVFVSSTFRDMIEDRNELMSQVWPALRRLCRG